jgi:putative aldouronate transport system permease protein
MGTKASSYKQIKLSYWHRKITPGKAIIYLILLVIFFITFYPFFYVLFLSVMPYDRFLSQPIHWLPNGFTLMYFKRILQDPALPRGYLISVLRTVIGTTLNVICTMMAGYALSRRKLKYGRILTFLFLIPMYFSAGLIPYYLTIRATHLTNTFFALIIPGLVASWWLFITRASFLQYPEEIIEAASIDGANQFYIFWHIIWPTSLPLIATLAVMYGTGHWNEYFFSRILVDKSLWPATAHLYNIIQSRIIIEGLGAGVRIEPQSYLAAMAAMLIIPILVVYPLLQRYVVAGIMVGGVKE